jgi:Uma2 family endonuclease
MSLPRFSDMSYEEYIALRQTSNERLEYIDGAVYMTPSPSIQHQLVSSNLHTQFGIYLKGKRCKVFAAPTDIELVNETLSERKVVIPDLSIICDEKGFTETKYVGVPTLIVEILSPSNQAYDLVTKFNLYMTYGVKEYWIVNPMKEAVTVYALNEEGLYEQADIQVRTGTVQSVCFPDLRIALQDIFGS